MPAHRSSAPVGSSPLTRGKRELRQLQARNRGLIPAHAGKTSMDSILGPNVAAHPRSRGENVQMCSKMARAIGSSPLTRGKRTSRCADRSSRRLIPAHAGKTCRDRSRRTIRRAHPRSRGENDLRGNRDVPACGSSPLTRGKPGLCTCAPMRPRLIPAHAGKTWTAYCPALSAQAHPRSRGENGGRVAGLRGLRGSSPLTRGKRDGVLLGKPEGRLIPAHAGKTLRSRRLEKLAAAHPRSRGENSGRVTSPMVTVWLIPAHAGKTTRRCRAALRRAAHPRSRGENCRRNVLPA